MSCLFEHSITTAPFNLTHILIYLQKIEEIVSANNGLSNLYDAQKEENEALQSKVNLLGIRMQEMKSNEKKLVRLHKSEIETSSQQYEERVTTLNHLLKQSVTTLQQAKKDKDEYHESETVKLSQQYEAQLAELRDLVATIQQEKQDKELVLFAQEMVSKLFLKYGIAC